MKLKSCEYRETIRRTDEYPSYPKIEACLISALSKSLFSASSDSIEEKYHPYKNEGEILENNFERIADLPRAEFKESVLGMSPGQRKAFCLFMIHRIDQHHAQSISQKEQLKEYAQGLNLLLKGVESG